MPCLQLPFVTPQLVRCSAVACYACYSPKRGRLQCCMSRCRCVRGSVLILSLKVSIVLNCKQSRSACNTKSRPASSMLPPHFVLNTVAGPLDRRDRRAVSTMDEVQSLRDTGEAEPWLHKAYNRYYNLHLRAAGVRRQPGRCKILNVASSLAGTNVFLLAPIHLCSRVSSDC